MSAVAARSASEVPDRPSVLVIGDRGQPGVNLRHSATQLVTTLVGATTRNRLGPLLGDARDEGEGLHGLAEPHVVGEHTTKFVVPQERQPVQAVALVVAQRGVEPLGNVDGNRWPRRRKPRQTFPPAGHLLVDDAEGQ